MAAKNTIPGDWLYMTPQEITVKDIKTAVEEYEVEIWEDAGVLEIDLKDGTSMDVEAANIHPKDEITTAFAQEHGVKTVFLITFAPENFEKAKEVMNKIITKTGGFFCGDTEDFSPLVK